MILKISGISIEVCKKDIKNMRLYVKPPNGKVVISAPLSMSRETIEQFVRSKVNWIKRHIAKFEEQQCRSKREYVSGETLYVWGKRYFLQTNFGGRNSLVLSGDKAVLTVRKGSTVSQREKYVREWYRKLLKAEIPQVLFKWENKTGLKAESWQVKNMTSRWGSCKIKEKKITLSLLLAGKDAQCLDYIILHELLHFMEKRHNQRFYNLLGKYMPAWRYVRAAMNKQVLD